jgi:uncharacterized repeat protein (TIGR03803 family)
MEVRMFIIIRRITNLSLLLLAVVLFSTPPGWSQTFQVIYNFGAGDAGPANPYAGVTLDGQGNLFGTTPEGGPYDFFCGWAGCGTVFELSPNGGGGWNEETIAEFDPLGHPTAPVVFDRLGNLYGFAYCLVDCVGEAPGEIFELIPSRGAWTTSFLYADSYDSGCVESTIPLCPVAFNQGHLFSSTVNGGTQGSDCRQGCGTVFTFGQQSALQPPYYLLAYAFKDGTDGRFPEGLLAFDGEGNVYGTTSAGGLANHGTVYMLTPNHSTEGWSETVLYSFQGGTADGAKPIAGVVLDAEGNVYGTTSQGGTANLGTVFKLTPQSNGTWSETVLYSFQGGNDAAAPNSTLAFDAAGNLYGTAGGGSDGQGTLFKLMPSSGGQWTESVLHTFTGGPDGGMPFGGVTIDSSGNMYGTASTGGLSVTGGTAFEITP